MMTCMTTTEVYLKTLLFCSFYVDLYQCVKYDPFCFHPCIRSLSFQKSSTLTTPRVKAILRSFAARKEILELSNYNFITFSAGRV